MGVNDRLRAKKPPEKDDRWKKCEIKEIRKDSVKVNDNGKEIELNLTEALVELFESRKDGKTAYYIKK